MNRLDRWRFGEKSEYKSINILDIKRKRIQFRQEVVSILKRESQIQHVASQHMQLKCFHATNDESDELARRSGNNVRGECSF